jgi:hypothetical protein
MYLCSGCSRRLLTRMCLILRATRARALTRRASTDALIPSTSTNCMFRVTLHLRDIALCTVGTRAMTRWAWAIALHRSAFTCHLLTLRAWHRSRLASLPTLQIRESSSFSMDFTNLLIALQIECANSLASGGVYRLLKIGMQTPPAR